MKSYIGKPKQNRIQVFTFLALAFIILLLVAIFYGYGIVMRKPPSAKDLQTEICSLCRRRMDKNVLIVRQVGDARLFYFCPHCIEGLNNELRHSQELNPESPPNSSKTSSPKDNTI